MNSTTISKLVTTTMEDLQRGVLDQAAEKSKIRKQLRFIQDLYSKFPLAAVAGGCPMNHNYGVAAKDIDIFVPSEEIAQAILAAYPVVSYELLGDPQNVAGRPETYSQSSYITKVHEAFVEFGRRKEVFHLNIIVLRGVNQQWISTRLSLAKYTTEYFPLPICKIFYAEVYGELRLCRPYTPVPMHEQTLGSEAYKERILRKALLLATQPWNLLAINTNYRSSLQKILQPKNSTTGYTVAASQNAFRNYDFVAITKAGDLAKNPSSPWILRDCQALSGLDLLNVIGANKYEEAERIYNQARADFESRAAAHTASLGQQARALVSSLWPTSTTGTTMSRPLSPDWVS